MRNSTFEINSLHSQNSHVGHLILIHGSTQLNMLDLILVQTPKDIFMYLIEGIRFSTWKVRHLNWALSENINTSFERQKNNFQHW